ncbi:MAG TPA: anti-sigma factor [Bacillota bacterium]|nr:anti-sigma factor [Bacillota bacterium]
MNCQTMAELLHGYLDKELDLVRSLEAEQHLKECPACLRRCQEHQALRGGLGAQALYFEAPAGLTRRVRTAVRQASRAEAPRTRRSWDLDWLWVRWLAPVALAGLMILVALPWLAGPSAESRLSGEIISAHVRSLQANHLTDVASSDQHTVKPWFNGKVTFSPPVVDPAAQGFPLVGGRLDVVEGQPVAALVYQRRKHFINLFIWPSNRSRGTREEFLAQRGYNVVHWAKGGMDYWAVSDVGRGELQEFAHLVGAGPEK